VSRKFIRLVLVASVAAGFGLAPMVGANAADQIRGVDVYNPPKGFVTPGNPPNPNEITIDIADNVSWHVAEGTHNITPVDAKAWGDAGSGDIDASTNPPYTVHFPKVGRYVYYSKGDATIDKSGKCTGMCGVVNVVDPSATTTTSTTTTTTTTTAPPTPDTTPHPGSPVTTPTTASAPAGVAGHVPTTAAPAPTTTTPTTKPDKKAKDGSSSTTTTAAPVSGPIDLSAEAIVPNVTPNGTATQDGVVQPSSTPEGDAVAVIKQKHGHKGMLVLVATGLGIGALGIGAAGYKYANRSSKYFPA
jgi:plastocyanin